MKKLKKIIAWTVIAIIIQQTIFLYLENVYCSTDISTRAEKVETKEHEDNDKMEIEIKSGVTNVTVSSDGKFVAYLDNGKLKVLDSSDNTEKEFENIYNSEERYNGEGAVTEITDDTNKDENKNTNKDTKSNEAKKATTSTVKQNESKKDTESTNKNQNINGSSDSNANESTGTTDETVDKPGSNTGNTNIPETPENSGTGPWNDSTPATGPGSTETEGTSPGGAGPWNDDTSTENPNINSSNPQNPGSTNGQESTPQSTESKENITENTSITRAMNVNPMLLANTNTLGNTEENITLLSKQGTSAKTIDAEIVFYKWLPNESNMIVIRKIKENGAYYFEPISFDAKKGKVRELADFDLNKMRIELQSTEDKVDDVAFSTSTNSLYIKIKKANGNCSLYYVNVMNQLERVKYNTAIGKVVVPTTNANAVIEENSEIKMLNNGTVSIPNVKNAKILGTDRSDNVYFGEVINDKINKIYYTVLSDKNRTWNELALTQPVEQQDIIIDYSGKVYVNNKLNNNVLELTTNQTISYKGDLLQSYSKGIISKDDDTILKYNIEE